MKHSSPQKRIGTFSPGIIVLLCLRLAGCQSAADQAAEAKAKSNGVIQEARWEKVADGLNFPEGPAWDGSALYFSNCYGGWIGRFVDGRVDTFLTVREHPLVFNKSNGLAYHDDFLFACDFGLGAILRCSNTGQVQIYVTGYSGHPFNRPNDLCFDAAGNLYFTDPKSYDREVLDGRIFRVSASDKVVTLAADSLGFPNGIIFSNDGKELYVCESAWSRVLRFAVQPDGTLRDKRVFVELAGGDPDGIDFDNEGNLYVAHFGGGAVYVISPDGSIKERIAAPGIKPTNIEFGGEDLRTLYLTEVETNALYRRRVEVAGVRRAPAE